MIPKEEYIPIDDAIKDFGFHLSSHPRTILSAGFGEGKTFFLRQCREMLSDCVFITLYPVNYQVAKNEDIFELIKRDVLFQLFLNGILKPTYPISESLAISFFLSNPTNYLEWIIDAVAALEYPDVVAAKTISSVAKLLKKAKGKYEDFCNKNGINEPDKHCTELWDKIESKGIYEYDVITRLINDSIQKWKKSNPKKRLVLLVEDLDRIDPAHLFRILNILSAHIDYSYKYGVSTEYESVDGNKFGVDNIVCVLDYNNLISIFRHFYGEYTSWEGYISKFSTKGYFKYSLSEEKCKYFYTKAAAICDVDVELIRQLIKEDIVKNTSMRVLNASIDNIDAQFRRIENFNRNGIIKNYPTNMLKFFVLARRLGKQDKEILDMVESCIKVNEVVKSYIMPYYFLMNDKDLTTISFGERDRSGYLIRYDFTQNNHEDSFKGEKSLLSGYNSDAQFPTFRDIIKFMLKNVGR